MAVQVIETPGGLAFAGWYYPEILRELLIFLRQNKDRLGLTDENEYEVHVQLLRSFANVGHLNNARLDTVATELSLDSAVLRESFKRLLRLAGVEMRSASPATADLIARLSEVTTADLSDFVPGLAEFGTDSIPPIIYESDEDGIDLDRTDQVAHVFAYEVYDNGTDGSVDINAPGVITGTFSGPSVGEHIFVSNSFYANGGEYRITEIISATQLRVVKVPGSETPAFTTEAGLSFEIQTISTDFATKANTDSDPFVPWASPQPQDAIYVGHAQAQVSQVELVHSIFGTGLVGVWEYFDNERSAFSPDLVTHNVGPGTLTLDVTPLLGSISRVGTEVTITYLPTGAKETVTSSWSGSVNTATTYSLLGQSTPSITVTDYHVTSTWVPFDNVNNGINGGSSDFDQDGTVTWDYPQDEERSWLGTEVDLNSGQWLRYRIINASAPTAPSIDRIKIDGGDQYIIIPVLQGETIGPQVLGSSDGSTNQSFALPDTPFLDDSDIIEIDEGGAGNWTEWTRVDSFLYSSSTSRHYLIRADGEDVATIYFGDGTQGRVPPAGVNNIRATYRVGGDDNGNVGANQILVNTEGVAGIGELWNPRSAAGWRIKDGGDELDLERLRRDGPAEVRARGTAATVDDIPFIARNDFVDSSGIKPVERAWAVEEGFGVKTVKLLVVGSGGTTLTEEQLEELETFFNGDRYANPPVPGVISLNSQVIAVNFQPSQISIDATVVWSGGSAEAIKNALLAYLTPLAVDTDGTTYLWDFGGAVSYSKIHNLIHSIDPTITDVRNLLINGTAASYSLGPDDLPTTVSSVLTINIQAE